MPNPRAQKNPTFIPQAMQGLADMGRGAVRGALAESLGTAGDLTQALSNIKTAGFMPAMLARGLQGPTSEEMSHALRGMTPNPLTQPDRAHTAQMGQTFGSLPVGAAAGTAGTNLANRMKQFQRTQAMMPRQPRSVEETLQPRLFTNTTETLAGYAGKAINDAMLGDTSGALSKALSGVAPRKLFIGPGSQAWDEQAAFQASKMEAAKASPQDIWAKTGTFRGPDGHWRQEISDKGSTVGLSQRSGSAEEIFKHPELYAAYPELAGTKMNLYGTMKGAPEIKASLSGTPKEGFQVDIYEPGIKDGPRLSAIHEMQHAIQDIEGFSPGGNRSQAFLHPSFQEIKQDTLKTLRPAGGPIDPVLLNNLAADSYYYRLGGEAEARAAARRANMDEAERKATFPLESYDMLPDRIINIAPYAGGGYVDGTHADDGMGASGVDQWRADNSAGGLAHMAAGGVPYRGINPIATGLGQMRQQSVVRDAASSLMAKNRAAQFANQGADRLARQNQLAAAKTARLNALAPKLSTYVPPAAPTVVQPPSDGMTSTGSVTDTSVDAASTLNPNYQADMEAIRNAGARGGLVSMADGGLGKKAAAKAFKALPGQSFQGKTGLSVLSPDEEARRLIAKMDQPTLEDTLAKISKQSNLEEVLKQKKAPAVKKVKPETEASVPFSIPRAAPKTDTEIRDIAERVARQQLGEHVRGKTSSNLAGRSMAEVERLKQLEYELTPNKQLPPVQVVEPMYGDINVAIPGDQSISDTILTSIRGEPIGALQQGGSRYGLGQLDRPLYAQAAWKSNIAASRGLQNRVDRLAKYYEKMSESQKFDYDPTRILGTYFGMGTDAMNYAQHFTDANLRAIQNRIKSGLMSDADIQQFNEIIRKGNPSVEGKKGGPFPDFPGIENMEDSYIAMTNDPNMRKWFNNRMKTPAITQKLNMPDGKEIEWAISEEELRNLEPFTTGHSIVQLRPGEQIALDPGHVTYTHRIPGKMLGRQQELSPIEVSHPDTIEFLRKNYRPSEVITTAQKIFPVQRVDQQYMDEMGKYQQYLRDIRGFKKGGKIKKMQAGGKAIVSGLQALIKPAKQTITSAIDPTMDIASRLSQPDRINLLPMPSRWFLDPKNNPNVQKLVEKVLEVNNMKRSDFYSGAFVNPRTGEVMDKKVMQDVGVLINPKTGRPMMSAEKETDLTIGDRKKGSITKSNLVRKQLYETEGDPILKDLDFLVAIEQSGMGHKYGLATEYATPAEMFNTMTGDNPTLRPKSQGDVFGIGDIVGRMSMKSSKMPHDVYESLLIAPKGSDVQGVKLSKKKGGMVRRRK